MNDLFPASLQQEASKLLAGMLRPGQERGELIMELLSKLHDEELSADARREIRDAIIVANIGLVYSVASKLRDYANFDDLVQEGVLGLMKAIDRFDVNAGTQFSTYAVNWIRNYMSRYSINMSVSIPENSAAKVRRIYRTLRRVQLERHIQTITDEVIDITAEQTGISRKAIVNFLNADRCVSLDEPVPYAGTLVERGELVAVENHSGERMAVAMEEFRLSLVDLLGELPPREALIVRLYYGIDCEKLTLEEIAKYMQISREWVRQLKRQAINMLRVQARNLEMWDIIEEENEP